MKVIFQNNELKDVFFIRKPELTYYPIERVSEKEEILEGFIWKPKERPLSKEEIIPNLQKQRRLPVKTSPQKPGVPKAVAKVTPQAPTSKKPTKKP